MMIFPWVRRAFPILLLTAAAHAGGVSVLQQPDVSPDGREVAFVTAGGIWTVPAAGGDATPLIANLGDLLRPLYSPDGHRLAFVSNKAGNFDIYVLSLETGELKRITYDDAAERLESWSPDGKWLYFSTSGRQVGATSDIYRIAATGGTPMPVLAQPYENDFFSAPASDGRTVAFSSGGISGSQWWRHGHAHIDCCSIWTTDGGEKPTYTRLTDDTSKHIWPMWSADGHTLYYMSDADGAENLYAQPVAGSTTQPVSRRLTDFHDGRLLWPAISVDGRTIVFERDFGLWKLDLATGVAGPIDIHLRGLVTATAPQRQTFSHDAAELAVSHDGRKVAVVVHGQIFAGSTMAGDHAQPAFRVTHTDAIESEVAWANDDRRLVYVSTRDGARHVYLYDFATRTETRMTDSTASDTNPVFSPDDFTLAYVRDGREVRAVSLNGQTRLRRRSTTRPYPAAATTQAPTTRPSHDRLLADGLSLPRPPWGGRRVIQWSPAGDFVAVISTGTKGFRNAYLIPASGGAPRQVSFVANAESTELAWTPDGSSLLFGSGQRTEDFELDRVDLKPRTPTFRTDQFSDLFRQRPGRPAPDPTVPPQPSGDNQIAADPTSAPAMFASTLPTAGPATRPTRTEVDFDGVEQRLSLLPIGVNVDEVAVSPDGKWAGVIGTVGDRANIYLYPLDPLVDSPVARQMTATATSKSDLQFAVDPSGGSARIYFREGGAIRYLPMPARGPSTAGAGADLTGDVPLSAELEVSFDRDKRITFDQAWQYLGEQFHDPSMHGLDWAAIRRQFEPRLDAAVTPADERRVLSLMIGELNSSHSGIAAPRDEERPNHAHLGISWDPIGYYQTGKLRVAAVLPFGPAALAGVKVGQFVSAVEARSIDQATNIEQLLEGKADKDVTLTVADDASGTAPHEVRLMAVSGGIERTLAYKAWVQTNRNYVAKASGNRLGYVHLSDMSKPALARLYQDLNARNEQYDGVVVDVRNNNGGFVDGYAIDVFARRNYITLKPRQGPEVTGRTSLGQRFLGLPTVLVTNRQTLSDGEDFTEGYQALGLGDTVGEPTAGWIVFTSDTTLMDGSSLRLPNTSVYDHTGQEMEMYPRPVTVNVQRPVGEPTQGRDSQLDAAVKNLLDKLK